ncbi:MAG TPA: hypothetical protein VEY09_16385 [Pyrinomonadaceae bacterium]|nr:hypothetical protein [Pyrinomonadaceae bacterium]
MESPEFQVKVIEQAWLDGCSSEEDLCSHGKIELAIGGEPVTSGDEDYGVSESALALLRTLNSNHSSDKTVAEHLIVHGCGTMLMFGCPIGVGWEVAHSNGRVRISKVVRHDEYGEADVVEFPNLDVEMTEEEYRREIVAFAKEAKLLFTGVTKVFTDEYGQKEYEDFWEEYDRLLNRYEDAV